MKSLAASFWRSQGIPLVCCNVDINDINAYYVCCIFAFGSIRFRLALICMPLVATMYLSK